jgi:hypothetical protein
MIKRFILPLIFATTLISCEELNEINKKLPLSEQEVVNGLKEALKVGTDSASSILSMTNGYYGNELLKIMLPPEANVIVDNISKIPGGSKMVEDLILAINRSAENAAKEVSPIFVGAITGMTIADGFDILKGENDAATQYLIGATGGQLFDLYNPKIKSALDTKVVANYSANELWNTLTSNWNTFAGSFVGSLGGYSKVETQLDTHLTNKALDGLFTKLAEQEAQIRTNPVARVTDILKRVFGFED